MANESASIQNEISNQIKEQKQLRKVILAQQTKLKNFVTANLNNMSAIDIETRVEMMEKQFKNFNKVQSEIERIDEEEINSSKRDTYEENFCLLKAKLRNRLEAIRPQSTPIVPQQITERSTRVHLPNIQLPKFSGNYTEWLDFYSLFKTLIHDNNELNDVERFQHLKSCLIGAPANILQSLELTSANYHNAIALLKGRYNNKRFIFQAHVEQIYATNTISTPTVPKLRNLVDIINGNYRALSSLGTKEQIGDGLLVHLAVTKLDMETRSKWEEELAENIATTTETVSEDQLQIPTWDKLVSFLERRCQAIKFNDRKSDAVNINPRREHFGHSNTTKKPYKAAFMTTNNKQEQSKCAFCSSATHHNSFNCETFNNMTALQRFELVKRLNLCINCLKGYHTVQKCMSKSKCRKCDGNHHTLLHRDQPNVQRPRTNSFNNQASISTTSCQAICQPAETLLATALIQISNEHGASTIGRAILDSASQLNFITENMVQKLGLIKQKIELDINGVGSACSKAHNKCILKLNSLHNEYQTNIEAVVLQEITAAQPQGRIDTKNWKLPNNIKLSDPNFNQPRKVDLLIGAGLFFELLQVGRIRLGDDLPYLQKTLFGWVLSGKVAPKYFCYLTRLRDNSTLPVGQLLERSNESNCQVQSDEINNYQRFSTNISDDLSNLDESLRKFWEIEERTCKTQLLSREEEECEKYFKQTTYYCKNTQRFTVRLPFREHRGSLGPSFNIARNRLMTLEYKLKNNLKLQSDYSNFLDDYIVKGHMEKMTSNWAKEVGANYLPHHCVVKPDNSTTKLRVVFDASCRTSSGKSLNDILKVGPTLQDDIFTILIRFRMHNYVVLADITQMYRQIVVHKDDAPSQCILWRDAKHSEVQTYQLKTVTYGTSSAPYLAVRCLRKLAEDFKTKHVVGSKIVLRDFYVDNLISGANSIQETLQIKQEVTELLKLGGFPLRKWATNFAPIIADIPCEERETIVSFGHQEGIKTLGMGWNPKDDNFCFSNPRQERKAVNKRTILSQIARFYDPLGLLCPVVVAAKIFLQKLWKMKLHWDESIPQEIHNGWITYCDELKTIEHIQIPRFTSSLEENIQLHGFADASERAYGACVYVRAVKNQKITCSLLCVKSRVALVRDISLPRLELQAMVVLVELFQKLDESKMLLNIPRYGWTDSTIALNWISSESFRWKTYIANRVSKIQQYPCVTWNHISSSENPADVVSRGASPQQLVSNELWFQGPKFLQQQRSTWPISTPIIEPQSLPEFKPQKTVFFTQKQNDIIQTSKFCNDYNKLIRTFCYVRRFLNLAGHRDQGTKQLTAKEHEAALSSIIHIIQQNYFGNEIKRLHRGEVVKDTKLHQLCPFMDGNILRVGGRLTNSNLDYTITHPIILPKSHQFTATIIRYYHKKYLHAGVQTLHNILREKFWIINARSRIRQIIKNCILCFRYRPITMQQVMGSLPRDRVTPSRPFTVVGVDYCGPILATTRTRGRNTFKVYLSIFICFSTKAVHLELVSDLSTACFLAAFKRFIARRGKCSVVYSDNATNFVGAKRQLLDWYKLAMSQSHRQEVENFCIQDGIEWRYIPPRSPHFGGLWESAIKVAKIHLQKILGTTSLTMEELSTLCCQIEAIMNSRPITPTSNDPNDITALTPGHFLIGTALTSTAEPNLFHDCINYNKRFQYVQRIQQIFWRRWSHDYLHQLQQRRKWTTPSKDLQINDLVLLVEENVPPLKWPMGRVQHLHTGSDGRVRVVTVKTVNGSYKRAITKVCLLPMDQNPNKTN